MPRESIFSLHDEALLRRRRGERIIDGTVGVLLDDAGRLAVLPTVAAALAELRPGAWAPYAPVAGEAWIDRIGVPRARVVETRKEYGNVGPANVLLNLDRGATNGAFRHGDKILLFGQGSGMSVGALLLQWHGRGSTPPQRPARIGTT